MATTNKSSTSHQNRTSYQNRSTHQNRSEESRSRAASMNETKPVSDLLDAAMDSYEKAFKTGLKLQEESGRWWTSFLEQTGPSREWQRTVRSMATELLPEAQKRV